MKKKIVVAALVASLQVVALAAALKTYAVILPLPGEVQNSLYNYAKEHTHAYSMDGDTVGEAGRINPVEKSPAETFESAGLLHLEGLDRYSHSSEPDC